MSDQKIIENLNKQIEILNKEVDYLLDAGNAKDNLIDKLICMGNIMASDYQEKVSASNQIIKDWKNTTAIIDE